MGSFVQNREVLVFSNLPSKIIINKEAQKQDCVFRFY